MKQVGLRFILNHGSFFQTVVSGKEAQQIIEWWTAHSNHNDRTIHEDKGSLPWAVRCGDIQAIHTFPVETSQVEMQPVRMFGHPAAPMSSGR